MSEEQPPLFGIPPEVLAPKRTPDVSDFLNKKGKKKKSIPTGMTREEINKLGRNKAPSGPAPEGADDWARD